MSIYAATIGRFNGRRAAPIALFWLCATWLIVGWPIADAAANSLTARETKLQPPVSEAAREDDLGAAVAIDGDLAAIGVPGATHGIGAQGAVDVYRHEADGAWNREAILRSSNAQELDHFGYVVSLDGDTLVVAARRKSVPQEDRAAFVYVFARQDVGWEERATFAWPHEAQRVSLAASGDRFAVGVPGDDGPAGEDQGAAYVYVRDGLDWRLEQRLTPDDPGGFALFGMAVALDGDRLLVSAPGVPTDPSMGDGVFYVFERVSDSWNQTARIPRPTTGGWSDTFGSDVELCGDIAVVAQSTWFYSPDAGAQLFECVDGEWTHVTTLRPDGADGWEFANRIALNERQLFISARRESDETNRAVFSFSQREDGWTPEFRIDSPVGGGDEFGEALDVRGSQLCAGAPAYIGLVGEEQGAAHVYRVTDTAWSRDATLERSADLLSDGDFFGGAVSVQDDMLIVGASYDCELAGVFQGSVYLYRRVGDAWERSQKLFAPDAQAGDRFGSSSSISGDRFVIGAGGADSPVAANAGAAYVFRRTAEGVILEARLYADDGEPGDGFGAVAIDGERIIVGASHAYPVEDDEAGVAYVFARIDGEWMQQARLVASDPLPRARFGYSVAIDGTRAVVGAYWAPDDYRGAVYVFTESDGVWTQEARLSATDYEQSLWFGLSVAIEGDTIAVGAPRVNNPGGADVGRVFVHSRSGGVWERAAVLRSSPSFPVSRFGSKVALHGDRLAVGAGSEGDSDTGAAYLFHRAGGLWSQALRVSASDTRPYQYFGQDGIAVADAHLIVGVPFDGNGTGLWPGAVHDYFVTCAGDVNGDWGVNGNDLIALLSSYGIPSGASRESGDLDVDGDVDLSDLATLLANLGASCP